MVNKGVGVAGKDLFGVSWNTCCSVSYMNCSCLVGINDVDLGLEWPLLKGHVIKDDTSMVVRSERFKLVCVADDKCWFLTVVNCPSGLSDSGVSYSPTTKSLTSSSRN